MRSGGCLRPGVRRRGRTTRTSHGCTGSGTAGSRGSGTVGTGRVGTRLGGTGRGGGSRGRGSGRRGGRGSGVVRLRSEPEGRVHDVHDLLRGLRGAQGRHEGLLHEGTRELGQQLEVLLVRAGRCGDEEDDVRGPVLGPEVHGGGEPRHDQGGLRDGLGPAVRDADPARDPGGVLGLPGQGVRGEGIRGARATLPVDGGREFTDHTVRGLAQVPVQQDQAGIDQI